MSKTLQTAIATTAFAVLVFAPAALKAQVCGGNSFQTCASVSVSATNLGGGVTQVVLTITNHSGFGGTYGGTAFTAMGIMGLPNFSYVANSLTTSGPGVWDLGTPGLSGAGIQKKTAGVNPSGSVHNALYAGQTTVFTFRITGVNAATVLAHADDWAIHGQRGPNDCSTKLVVIDGVGNVNPTDPDCVIPGGGGGSSVTPEPASMLLLASGLAGMAGAGARRRRRSSSR